MLTMVDGLASNNTITPVLKDIPMGIALSHLGKQRSLLGLSKHCDADEASSRVSGRHGLFKYDALLVQQRRLYVLVPAPKYPEASVTSSALRRESVRARLVALLATSWYVLPNLDIAELTLQVNGL